MNALDVLNEYKTYIKIITRRVGRDKDVEKAEIIIAALEKQIPKKPQQASQPCFYWCPNCELAVKRRIESSIKIINNCPFCGQAIDWSDTE
ncbi:MAG: hypothetical protein U0L88_16725 [Acutalibacteraceae bacterium]|nr:hypothetical protein [Acutalibacteraceae bacterium]